MSTIEQNQIAIDGEVNNKAILLFIVVTTIFLPLSFFTSYLGMNLSDIRDTHMTQNFFWAICGSITTAIATVILIFGFKSRIYRLLWTHRQHTVKMNIADEVAELSTTLDSDDHRMH